MNIFNKKNVYGALTLSSVRGGGRYLQRAVQHAEPVELLAQQGVIGAPDEGALVLQACAGSGVRARGQTGPLQSPVQVPQRVSLQPALPFTV